jgi:hypothetical protein
MSRRELWLSVLLVGSVALLARIVTAMAIPFPIPEDTAYYYGVARNLVEGRGLVTDALWSFQTTPLVLPGPAFEVWLPLPSLLAALPMALLGTGFRVAQVLPVVIGTVIPVLAWQLAMDVAAERRLPPGRARTLALGAGITAAVELPLLLHSALPDSTALFAALTLGACLLMARILADPRGARVGDRRLLALGACLGLAALTRNEALWLAVVWVGLVASRYGVRGARVVPGRLILIPAVVAGVIFAPWAIRDWVVFGSPLPGQALANALSVTGFDIFAWQDPPTLARYLAQGPVGLLQARLEGFGHNLLSVLLLPSFPIGLIGLLGLRRFGRDAALRPLLVFSLVLFAVTTVVFPVATTWGTYLHAAGATHVLLIVGCLGALDALIVAVGRLRGWTRPVAWLGPALTSFAAVAFSLALLPSFALQAEQVQSRYAALSQAMTASGSLRLDGPVISDFPIWFAVAERWPAVALPDESPESVLSLARAFPGTRYLVISSPGHGRWPQVLTGPDPLVACFRPVPIATAPSRTGPDPLRDTLVFELICP